MLVSPHIADREMRSVSLTCVGGVSIYLQACHNCRQSMYHIIADMCCNQHCIAGSGPAPVRR